MDNLPLIAVAIALGIFWILAFINLYHLVRFGVGRAPKVAAFIFFMGSLVLMIVVLMSWLNLSLNV